MLNLKDFIEKEITKLKIDDNYKKDELIACVLSVVYNKPYFNNRFENFFIYRNNKNDIRFTSPVYNDVSGATRLHVNHFICQNSMNDNTDDFFCGGSDLYYLKGTQRRNLISFYKLIKERNSFKSFKKKFKEYAKDNGEALLDFELIFHDLANPEKHSFYNFLISNFQINETTHDLHSIQFKKRGQIKKADHSGVNSFNFREVKYYYWKLFRKEMVKIRKINLLIKEHQYFASKLLKAIYKKYPILLNKVERKDVEQLKYYIYEIPANFTDNNEVINFRKDEKTRLNTKGFEYIKNDNKSFRELLYYSPFMMNKDHQNTFNSLEGLIYVNDFNLKNTSAFHQFFIVAKNKYEETIGVLSLQQPIDMTHFTKIGEISIKQNYRNLGIAKKLYSKMAELAINNDLVITNRMYSAMGRMYLPKMKQQIIEEYPDLLLINSNFGEVYDFRELNSCIESYNHFLINDIQIQDRMNMFNLEAFKFAYKKGLEYIMQRSELPEFYEHKVKEEALNIFKENNKKP